MEQKSYVTPRGNKVLIKSIFNVSAMSLLDDETIKRLYPDANIVVDAGNVKDLKKGDKVVINPNSMMHHLDFDWNDQSLKVKRKIRESGNGIIGAVSIQIVEYYLAEDYDIIGVWNDNSKIN